MTQPTFFSGLSTTPKDRVKRVYPQAVVERAKTAIGSDQRWTVYDGPDVLGSGANASRAWENAASRLPRDAGRVICR
jgi:hypothetical protein